MHSLEQAVGPVPLQEAARQRMSGMRWRLKRPARGRLGERASGEEAGSGVCLAQGLRAVEGGAETRWCSRRRHSRPDSRRAGRDPLATLTMPSSTPCLSPPPRPPSHLPFPSTPSFHPLYPPSTTDSWTPSCDPPSRAQSRRATLPPPSLPSPHPLSPATRPPTSTSLTPFTARLPWLCHSYRPHLRSTRLCLLQCTTASARPHPPQISPSSPRLPRPANTATESRSLSLRRSVSRRPRRGEGRTRGGTTRSSNSSRRRWDTSKVSLCSSR